MKWVEKYAPKTMGDVLGNAKTKVQIEKWAGEWSNNNPQKPLLLLGPPGIGKTTIAHLIGKEYFSETIEVNASDKRSYDIIKKTVGEASQTKSLYDVGYKLIIMDEVDGINGRDDSGGVRAINETIKNTKQPLIMMANDPYSKRLTTIKSKCQTIKLTKVHTNTINATLKRICAKEGIEFEVEAIKQLSKQSSGDLRSAINDLEALSNGTEKITMDTLKVISQKDATINVFDTVRTVLKSKTPAHVLDAMRVEVQPQFLLELLAENIPREYEKTYEIARAYEMIALADLNLGRAFRTQNYTYWKYAFLFMGRGVASAKKETYKKFARYTNSSVYGKLSKGRKNKTLKEAVTQKMSKRLHTSPKELEKQLPFYEEMFKDNEQAYDLKEYFKLDDNEVKLFRSRKIPVSVEKKRIKELKKQQELEEKEIQKQKKEQEKKSPKKEIIKEKIPTTPTKKEDTSIKKEKIDNDNKLEDKTSSTKKDKLIKETRTKKTQKQEKEETTKTEKKQDKQREDIKTKKTQEQEKEETTKTEKKQDKQKEDIKTKKTQKQEKEETTKTEKKEKKSKQTTLFDF